MSLSSTPALILDRAAKTQLMEQSRTDPARRLPADRRPGEDWNGGTGTGVAPVSPCDHAQGYENRIGRKEDTRGIEGFAIAAANGPYQLAQGDRTLQSA
jgi:hypothetical protein